MARVSKQPKASTKGPDNKSKVCEICKGKFVPAHKSVLTCSDKCKSERVKRQMEHRANEHLANKAQLTCAIPGCNNKFKRTTSSQKYCGPECSAKGLLLAIDRQTKRRQEEKVLKSKESKDKQTTSEVKPEVDAPPPDVVK